VYSSISSCTRLMHNQPIHKSERTQPTADTPTVNASYFKDGTQVTDTSQDALDTYHMHELRGVELTNKRTTPAHADS